MTPPTTARIAIFVVALLVTTTVATAEGLADLAWLAGTWQGRSDGTDMEEHWTEPRGGLMLGLHRDLRDGRSVFFEFLRIEETADGIVYIAQPRGRDGTSFALVESAAQRAVFANPEHDFPQRILYWLDDDGALHARIEGEQQGEATAREWRWQKAMP